MANEAVSFPVTARRIGPSRGDLTTPRVFYLTAEDLKRVEMNRSTSKGGAVIFLKNQKDRKIETYESVDEIRAIAQATVAAVSADPLVGHLVAPAVTGVSGGITTTSILTRYLNIYTSATGASANVRLPAPSDRNAVVLINTLSTPVSVFPNGASAFIDGGASGASKTLPAFKRLHFVTTPTSGNGASARWVTAIDRQQNAQ